MCESSTAGAQSIDRGDNSEFSFNIAVRGFHVDRKVWLPHFEQPLREHGIAKDRSRCSSEHSDTGANDDKVIVGHLPQEFLRC